MASNEFGESPKDVWGVVQNPDLGKAPFAIRVLREKEHLRTVRLEPDVTYIGRMPENHVVLDDAKVSRSHARIIKKRDQFVIEDQQSENGIYVNGKKVQEFALKAGLLVGIGSHVLEIVRAQTDDREANLERQLDEAEDEQWRMDQTISGNPEQIAKIVAERTQKKKEASKSAPPPKMTFDLHLGNKSVQKEFEFTQARGRKPEDPKEDQVEVRITIGKWVLYKKVNL